MPYVPPGHTALLANGVTAVAFPTGGYIPDLPGDATNIATVAGGFGAAAKAYSHLYTPAKVVGNAAQGLSLYLPDVGRRCPHPKPAAGWPVLIINAPGAYETTSLQPFIPLYDSVTPANTSNAFEIAHRALDAGWAVVSCSVAGPGANMPVEATGAGLEMFPWNMNAGSTPNANYDQFSGPGSDWDTDGYADDLHLTMLKQAVWQVQYIRERATTGDWAGVLNPNVMASLGVSSGTPMAWIQAYGPEFQDPNATDFRRFSSRTQAYIGLNTLYDISWTPNNEGGVYCRWIPDDDSPTDTSCSTGGWVEDASGAVGPALTYAVNLSLDYLAFRGWDAPYGFTKASAPEMIAHAATVPAFMVGSEDAWGKVGTGADNPELLISYAGSPPAGVGSPARAPLLTNIGAAFPLAAVPQQSLSSGGTLKHTPLWSLMAFKRLLESDSLVRGKTHTGVHHSLSQLILPRARVNNLNGDTTTGSGTGGKHQFWQAADTNSPYPTTASDPLSWASTYVLAKEDVETTYEGASALTLGFHGLRVAHFLNKMRTYLYPESWRGSTPAKYQP